MDDDAYDLDILMNYLGDFGKYQAWQFALHIISALTSGINMMSLLTVAAVPDHRCEIPGVDEHGTYSTINESVLELYIPRLPSGKFDSCSLINTTTNSTYPCNSWIFDHQYYESSRAIEWSFVCSRRWMGAVAQSSYMFGVFTGAVVLGNLADKIGRKPVFCWSAVLQLIFGIGVAFTPGYASFLIFRYLYGIFGSAGSFITGFVLTIELVGPSKRSICGIAFQVAFSVGIMLVAGWGSVIKDRQLLQIIYGCHAALMIGHFWFMDESPRWLWANGKVKESVEIIKKALKMNGSPIDLKITEYVTKEESQTKINNEIVGTLDLFKTPNLRKKTLNVMLCWFANSLVYYGLSLNTGKIKGNPYTILFIMGLIELPSYAAAVYLMDRLGRRSLTSFDMILGGICCIVAANLASDSTAATLFTFTGKFLIVCSFGIIYNYSAELFPTAVRNSAIGLGSMCARAAGALTPLIILLDSFDPKLPAIIFAIISLVSGYLVMFLPETMDKPMPQTIEDGEKFGVGDTCFTSMFKRTKEDKEEEEIPLKGPDSAQLKPEK